MTDTCPFQTKHEYNKEREIERERVEVLKSIVDSIWLKKRELRRFRYKRFNCKSLHIAYTKAFHFSCNMCVCVYVSIFRDKPPYGKIVCQEKDTEGERGFCILKK